MAWLIESFLNEGKQGPDHPESRNMRDKWDFDDKKREEDRDEDYSVRRQIRKGLMSQEHDGKHGTKNSGLHNNPHAKMADVYSRHASNAISNALHNNDDSEYEKYKRLKKKENAHLYAADAQDRHERRHPEKKAANESVDMLVEIMQ